MAKEPSEPFADVAALLEQGRRHHAGGKAREAAAAFHQVLWLDPGNRQARDYLRGLLGAVSNEAASKPSLTSVTGWDDGPAAQESITIEYGPDDSGEREQLISAPDVETPPIAEDVKARMARLGEEAKSAAALGDYTGAVERCDRILALDPKVDEIRKLRESSVATLIQMYEAQIGGRDGVPELVAQPDELIWLGIDHRAGFVLAQIDGRVSYDDLYAICGMSRLDTSRILAQLVNQKVVRTRSASRPH